MLTEKLECKGGGGDRRQGRWAQARSRRASWQGGATWEVDGGFQPGKCRAQGLLHARCRGEGRLQCWASSGSATYSPEGHKAFTQLDPDHSPGAEGHCPLHAETAGWGVGWRYVVSQNRRDFPGAVAAS